MRSLPFSKYAGDLGYADAALAEALADYGAGRATPADVLVRVCGARLLVPLVATLGEAEVGPEGLARDTSADMHVALIRRPADGRTALLAFTGLDALRLWRLDARPSPVSVTEAAQVAAREGASALLLDPSGPVPFVVGSDDLAELAAGHALVSVPEGHAWVAPADPRTESVGDDPASTGNDAVQRHPPPNG